jgi:hypothetical protein
MAVDICDLCDSIPFEQLPSEEDSGYPHQPSLAALQSSAEKCRLCKMILAAVDGVQKSVDNERRKVEVDGFLMVSPKKDSRGASQSTIFGNTPPPLDNRVQPSEAQMLHDMHSRLQVERLSQHTRYPGDVLRPWLFGNWWVVEHATEGIQQTRQLIGVGVRLGKTPQIHDAEGNSKEKVVYRGSGLRIRADEGELSNFASVYFTWLTAAGRLTSCDVHSW